MRDRTVAGFVVFLALAALMVASPAGASHDTPCRALPTSGQRSTNESCNPRQECINRIPGHVQGPARNAAVASCNAMPTSGQCSRTVNVNPRQECIDRLPHPFQISISGVEGSAGGNAINAGEGTLVVRGSNVGVPGNTVRKLDEQVWGVDIVPRQGCGAPDCVALSVRTGNIGGTWRFVLSAVHGHSEATGYFQTRLAPAEPPGRMAPLEARARHAAPKPDLRFLWVRHDLWGEKVKVQIGNTGGAPSPPALVYMHLYRLGEGGQRTSLTSAHKDIIPLCPSLPGTAGTAPCPSFWEAKV